VRPDVNRLSRIAGTLALDFTNTMAPRSGDRPIEYLIDARSVLEWGAHVGLCRRSEAAEWSKRMGEGARAARFHAQALELREAIFSVFVAVATARRVPSRQLRVVENAYRLALGQSELSPSVDRFEWRSGGKGPERLLAAIVRDAVELLTSNRLHRVKLCASPDDCGWLFLDATRSNTRRWCAMEVCGTQAKVRRQRAGRRAVRA